MTAPNNQTNTATPSENTNSTTSATNPAEPANPSVPRSTETNTNTAQAQPLTAPDSAKTANIAEEKSYEGIKATFEDSRPSQPGPFSTPEQRAQAQLAVAAIASNPEVMAFFRKVGAEERRREAEERERKK